MGRSKRFVGGVVPSYVHQGLVMLVGLWLTPFLLGQIGQHDYGIWLIGLQVLAYLSLVDIGVAALLPREIAYATGRAKGLANCPELPLVIGRTVRVICYQAPVVAAGAILIWWLMPQSWQPYRGPIGLILAAFTLLFPLRVVRAAVEGLQDLQFAAMVQIVTWSIGIITTVVLVLAGFRLYALAVGWILTQALAIAALGYRLWSRFPQVFPLRRAYFASTGLLGYVKRGLWVSMNQIAQPLLNGADILIIGKLLGPAAVVPYACTGKLMTVLGNQPQLLLQAAVPGLSEIRAGEAKEHLLRVTRALTQAVLMVTGALACIVLIANQGFVNWWVGPEQFGGHKLTLLIIACTILRHWNVTAIYTLFSYGFERRMSLTVLLDGIATVAASAVLIAWLGPVGGPLGSIVGVCLLSLPANLSAIACEAGVSLMDFLQALWPWFSRFSLLAAGIAVLIQVWAPRTIWQSVAAAVLTALTYAVVMLPVGRSSAFWPYLRPRLAPIWNGLSVRSGWIGGTQ